MYDIVPIPADKELLIKAEVQDVRDMVGKTRAGY
jgi:hypothetical protein